MQQLPAIRRGHETLQELQRSNTDRSKVLRPVWRKPTSLKDRNTNSHAKRSLEPSQDRMEADRDFGIYQVINCFLIMSASPYCAQADIQLQETPISQDILTPSSVEKPKSFTMSSTDISHPNRGEHKRQTGNEAQKDHCQDSHEKYRGHSFYEPKRS